MKFWKLGSNDQSGGIHKGKKFRKCNEVDMAIVASVQKQRGFEAALHTENGPPIQQISPTINEGS